MVKHFHIPCRNTEQAVSTVINGLHPHTQPISLATISWLQYGEAKGATFHFDQKLRAIWTKENCPKKSTLNRQLKSPLKCKFD